MERFKNRQNDSTDKFKKMKEDIAKRTQESFDRKDYSGRYISYINESALLNFWKAKEGDHLVDIVPFIAGKNFPTVPQPNINPGDWTYFFEAWVHNNIGSNDASVICLNRTFGKECAICSDIKEKRKQGDFDDNELKILNPKRRVLYNVVVCDTEVDEAKGVRQWEIAHWSMEKHLVVLAKSPRKGGIVVFSDLEEGKTIAFTRKGSGADSTEYLGHRFEDRDYKIPENTLEQTKSLDELVNIPTSEQVHTLYYGSNVIKSEAVGLETDSNSDDIRKETGRDRLQRKTSAQEENKCLGGGSFGLSIEKLPYCEKCEVWDDCVIEEERIEKEKKQVQTGGKLRRQ